MVGEAVVEGVAASGDVGCAGGIVVGSAGLAGFEKMLKGFWNAVTNDDHVLVDFDFSGGSEATADEAGPDGGRAPADADPESHGFVAACGSIAWAAAACSGALVKAESRLAGSAGHDEGADCGSVGGSVGVDDTKRLGGGSLVAMAGDVGGVGGVGDEGDEDGCGVSLPAERGVPVAKLESCRTFAVTSEIEPRPAACGAAESVSGLPSPGVVGKSAAARSAAERSSVATLRATPEASPVDCLAAVHEAASWAARAAVATSAVDVDGQSNRARIALPSPSTHAEGTCDTSSRLVRPGR